MGILERILAADKPKEEKGGPEVALKNYKGFDIFETPGGFKLFNRKYNSWERGGHKGLDSAKHAADEKFATFMNQDKKKFSASYPMLARVLDQEIVNCPDDATPFKV